MVKITGSTSAYALQMSIRVFFLSMLIVFSKTIAAQDVIHLRNGKEIACKITKIDDSAISYDFFKGERKLSSFVSMSEVRSYTMHDEKSAGESDFPVSENLNNTVVVDTTKYVKETRQWVNLVTYSQQFGVHAKGWSIQYYGYAFTDKARWFIPMVFAIESFDIDQNYFDQSGYYSADMSFYNIGVSPFYKLSDYFYLNLGLKILLGQEDLKEFNGNETNRFIFGVHPSQGIFFIPKSRFGITMGVSVYEKLLTSRVFENDLGMKLELGIKF